MFTPGQVSLWGENLHFEINKNGFYRLEDFHLNAEGYVSSPSSKEMHNIILPLLIFVYRLNILFKKYVKCLLHTIKHLPQ